MTLSTQKGIPPLRNFMICNNNILKFKKIHTHSPCQHQRAQFSVVWSAWAPLGGEHCNQAPWTSWVPWFLSQTRHHRGRCCTAGM